MCFEDIEQHKLILEKGKELLKVAFDSDKHLISEIVNKSKNIIDNYNTEKLTVADVTKWEKGTFKGVTKTILKPYFFKDYLVRYEKKCFDAGYIENLHNSDLICDNCKEIRVCESEYGKHNISFIKEIEELCVNCKQKAIITYDLYEKLNNEYDEVDRVFKESIENTDFSIELMNKYILLNRKKNDVNYDLEKAIRDNLRLQIIKEYQEQNQNLINKYN